MTAYYQLLESKTEDDVTITKYKSTIHAQGAWNEHEQHIGPTTGVICRDMMNYLPRDDMRIGRLSFDILGVIPFGEIQIKTHTIRSGRTIELIESVVSANDRTYVIARAWRMQMSDTTEIKSLQDMPAKPLSACDEIDIMSKWGGGFMYSLRTRRASDNRLGHGLAWVSTETEMVEGNLTSDFVRLMGLVDTANGISPCIEPKNGQWIYPNLDLQIHMHRMPQGQWLGLETVQQIGTDGIGLTSSILHDVHGVFGRSEQILTVRKLISAKKLND
ncbi:MAG: thioesterase [Gammaproteobacteria bacterium]|nr:MAG: thioesterase [Gammaproteobacteria bacterium]